MCGVVCYTSRQRSMTEFSDEKKVMEVKLVLKWNHVSINALTKVNANIVSFIDCFVFSTHHPLFHYVNGMRLRVYFETCFDLI